MSFDRAVGFSSDYDEKFQSLWNRAMSFDTAERLAEVIEKVSIPLEQGNVFRLG